METIYTAYTKTLDCKTHYFIKKFTAFPELKNVSPILDAYGMHTNFDKACTIAGITNVLIKDQLLQQVQENVHTPQAKVFEMGAVNFISKTIAG